MVVVADGTAAAARRLERVLTADPGTGVMRHADAGYPEAIAAARRAGGVRMLPHESTAPVSCRPRLTVKRRSPRAIALGVLLLLVLDG